jgi:hypothetical protein
LKKGRQNSPCILRNVPATNPIAARRQMAAPERNGIKPLSGAAREPILYEREKKQIRQPKRKNRALLNWS